MPVDFTLGLTSLPPLNQENLNLQEIAKQYGGEVEVINSRGFVINTPDRKIYFGECANNMISSNFSMALDQGDEEISQFVRNVFLPQNVECFVQYTDSSKCEIVLHSDQKGEIDPTAETEWKDIKAAQFLAKKTITLNVNQETKEIIFEGDALRIGLIVQDAKYLLKDKSCFERLAAKALQKTLGIDKVALTLNLKQFFREADSGKLGVSFTLNETNKITIDESLEPKREALKAVISKAISYTAYTHSDLQRSFGALRWENVALA